MYLDNGYHLTYCNNIHAGETWSEVYQYLKTYLPSLKQQLSPDKPFGIGLRLSDKASRELQQNSALQSFKEWLSENGLYLFTMSGFSLDGSHHKEIKDNIHKPDWTTEKRHDYTVRLANILAELLPAGIQGSISTSPLTYKPWLIEADAAKVRSVYTSCTENIIRVVEDLLQIKAETGKTIHVDIEPEPDGLLQNTEDVISYYKDWLLPLGLKKLQQTKNLTREQSLVAIYQHIQVCYDVCHFALAYEKPAEAFSKLQKAGIRIGKIQLSAALKTKLPHDVETRGEIAETISGLAEPTHLHQVVERSDDGELTQYADLTFALQHIRKPNAAEWRMHFHVPLFMQAYNGLQSTQEDVAEVLRLIQQEQITQHLEVETYTWEVLPEEVKQDVGKSIQRELEWVLQTMNAADDSSERSRPDKVSY